MLIPARRETHATRKSRCGLALASVSRQTAPIGKTLRVRP